MPPVCIKLLCRPFRSRNAGAFCHLKTSLCFRYLQSNAKALQKYDISVRIPFLIFKEFYIKNKIDKYICIMRIGYFVQSVDEYHILKKTMVLYAKYEYRLDYETVAVIARRNWQKRKRYQRNHPCWNRRHSLYRILPQIRR